MRGKDRWHALFIFRDDTTSTLDLLHEYRTRQQHEQGHRIGVHDLWIDASPSGYPTHDLYCRNWRTLVTASRKAAEAFDASASSEVECVT